MSLHCKYLGINVLTLVILCIVTTGCKYSYGSVKKVEYGIYGKHTLGYESDNWTVTELESGLVVYSFLGFDSISMSSQCVNVLEIDPSLFSLKFFANENGSTASEVLEEKDAVAVMNGAYEFSSVYVKADGKVFSSELSTTIMKTGVPNWKSDGAVALDSFGHIHFINAIPALMSTPYGSYGKCLEQQRNFYNTCMDAFSSVFSSSPILIYNDEPLGLSYVPKGVVIDTLAYEHPYRHQGSRHPRSVIAMRKDGKLLLCVADGRFPGQAEGFTAHDLTMFLISYFNPRYALNMDGGGSSCLCISDDYEAKLPAVAAAPSTASTASTAVTASTASTSSTASTAPIPKAPSSATGPLKAAGNHKAIICNHPCDSKSWTDHKERRVGSFFYLVKR